MAVIEQPVSHRKSAGGWRMGLALLLCFGLASACGAAPTITGPSRLGEHTFEEAATRITVARTHGSLSRRDGIRDGNIYTDSYAFYGRSLEQAIITLDSSDFDCYLFLYDGTGRLITSDDDGGSGFNSRIVTNLPSDGIYQVVASAYSSGEGGYVLVLERHTSSTNYTRIDIPGMVRAGFGARTVAAFALEGTAGVPLSLRLETAEPSAELAIYDIEGRELSMTSNRVDSDEQTFRFTPLRSSDYFIVVSNDTGSATPSQAVFVLAVSEPLE